VFAVVGKMKLIVASNNKNKIREIKQILGDMFEPVSLSEAGLVSEPEETGTTFAENALIKARSAYEECKREFACIADDSGLCVNALNGAPGVYSARYSGKGDAANNELLLKNVADKKDRNAVFRSAIALILPDGTEIIAEGECKGIIIDEQRGNNGFGYDPLFLVEEYGKTFAELDGSVKNIISHRANALKNLRKKLEEINL